MLKRRGWTNFCGAPFVRHRFWLTNIVCGLQPGADTGGDAGDASPHRPKEVLTRHLISLKIIAKILLYCTLLAKDAKIKLMLTISQKRFFVSLDELTLFMEPDIK